MSQTTLPKKPAENWQQVRNQWIAELEHLAHEVETWAKKQKWDVLRDQKRITEDRLGSYDVPVVLIHTPQGRLLLDPVARFVTGADGRIDLCIYPSYYDALVIAKVNDQWLIKSLDQPNWEQPWGEESFLAAKDRLLGQWRP